MAKKITILIAFYKLTLFYHIVRKQGKLTVFYCITLIQKKKSLYEFIDTLKELLPASQHFPLITVNFEKCL